MTILWFHEGLPIKPDNIEAFLENPGERIITPYHSFCTNHGVVVAYHDEDGSTLELIEKEWT